MKIYNELVFSFMMGSGIYTKTFFNMRRILQVHELADYTMFKVCKIKFSAFFFNQLLNNKRVFTEKNWFRKMWNLYPAKNPVIGLISKALKNGKESFKSFQKHSFQKKEDIQD